MFLFSQSRSIPFWLSTEIQLIAAKCKQTFFGKKLKMLRFGKIFDRKLVKLDLQKAFVAQKPKVKRKTDSSKILKKFHSDKGRTASFFMVMTGGTTVVLIRNAMETSLQGYQEDIHQHFTHGHPTKLGPKLKSILADIAEDMNMSQEDVDNTKVIIANVSEPKALGYRGHFSKNVLLMLPHYFKYNSEADAPKSETFKDKVDYQSLILSDQAKQFGIAREIQRSNMGVNRLENCFIIVLLCSAYILSRFTNTKWNLLKQSFKTRLVFYGAFACIHIQMWFFVMGLLRYTHANELDDIVARLSLKYAQGGVEYYSKERDHNLSLRNLTEVGPKKINLKGNVIPSILYKEVTTTERLDNCQKIVALHHAGLN